MKISFEKIGEAKKELGDTAKDIIAEGMHLEQWDGKKALSPFKEENTPSFIWNPKDCYFKCFSTGRTFGILDYFQLKENVSYKDAVKCLFDLVGYEYENSDFVDNCNEDIYKGFKFADDEQENDRKVVEEYMSLRGISTRTLDFCNVKQDEHDNVAYQFLDINSKHIQTKYRVSRPATNKEDYKWTWQSKKDVCSLLYGLDKVDISKPLLIVEGLNDRLACVEAGFTNVVSIPGSANEYKWIEFNYEILEKLNSIIIWSDDDTSGDKMRTECVNRLGLDRTLIVKPNAEVKEKITEAFEGKITKIDANNVLVACGKDEVLKLINGAEGVPNPYIKKLMDAEEVQLQDLPHTSTGIVSLDKIFFGTFSNSLTILTGKSGGGKSSLINTMFVAAPLENGEKIFIYSGEIKAGILLGNIIKPLASKRHILRFKNEGQPDGFVVHKDASAAIKKYYRDSLYNFDDINQFDTNSKTVLSAMEYAYKRYGVTNFIIDSLLTMDCSKENGDDKWEKQKSFCILLKNFTNRNPVKVCLVVHSRKMQMGNKKIEQDDIAGSSDIIKCANRAFSIEVLYDDEEGFNNQITCLKDRETGLAEKKVKLYYDRSSFRIYGDRAELERAYSWEKDFHPNYSENLTKNIVANIQEERKVVDVLG